MSLSNATNAMRRAIEALFYRELKTEEKDRIWKYFSSRCAYCDKLTSRKDRHGHMDHLDCSAFGGGNYIRNRVLGCKECNGNEKRETPWEIFLKSKCPDVDAFKCRRDRIRGWQKQFPKLPPIVLSKEAEEAKIALNIAIKEFEQRFVRFRSLIGQR